LSVRVLTIVLPVLLFDNGDGFLLVINVYAGGSGLNWLTYEAEARSGLL
jgi:hypothetical protein